MKKQRIMIGTIPAAVWGEDSDRVFLFVHGKQSSKDAAEPLAAIADARGFQTLSFDLPAHGERIGRAERCDVWTGTRDLRAAADRAFSAWREVSLFACSLGAYFSLDALRDRPLRRCLFQSPIVDMEALIRQMMVWFGVTPERLEREGEIETPVDTMSWAYYQYVLARPLRRWDVPTEILYGAKDELQPPEVIRAFCRRFGAGLTVAENSGHAFMDAGDDAIVRAWLEKCVPGREQA
ncbi:MAG: alpha/beta hydrolase [Oscillospiraceae bacterium]|nr:alpha/beta hydrolase [Oscillospiraceae bacterium]